MDAAGRLVAPPLFEADDDARVMLAGLPLAARLADAAWAEGARAVDPKLAPPLDVRRAALALAEAAGDAGPADAAASAATVAGPERGDAPGVGAAGADGSTPAAAFADPVRRDALYRWWARHAGEIEADEHARGALGKAALIETAGGWLRAPRELVLDPDVPDLGLDLEPSARVPAALVAHLRRAWRLDRARLAAVVEPLLEAHRAAEQAGDGERSAELLAGLAGLLGDGLDEAAGRFKLRKRLRAEADDGTWLRPKALLVTPDGAEADAVAGFLSDPPRQAHGRYGARARAVLVAAGAAAALDEARLAAALDGQGRRAGADADRAFAGYVAVRVAAEPALARRLRLDARDWVPTLDDGLAAPGALFWPDAEVRAVLGAEAPLPDAAGVPALAGARAHLAFRTLDEAGPEGVVAGLPAGEAAPAAALDWLEGALEAHRTTARAVREAWGDRAALVADDGRVLPPSQVCVEAPAGVLGGRRGAWSEGRGRPRLAAALGVPRRPDVATLQAVLGEVADDVERSGGDMLARSEPALLDALPRLLEALAEAGGRPPARWALAVQDAAGRLTLRRAGDAAVALPRPAEAVSEAKGRLFPWTGEADPEALLEALAEWGLPDLLGRVRAVERARAAAAEEGRALGAGRGAAGHLGDAEERRDLPGTSGATAEGRRDLPGTSGATAEGRGFAGTAGAARRRGEDLERGEYDDDHDGDHDDDHAGPREARGRDLGGTSRGDGERKERADRSQGLWSRMKRLFGGDEADDDHDDDRDDDHDDDHDVAPPERSPASPRGVSGAAPQVNTPSRRRRDTADGTPQGGDWFRPRDTIESQLGGGPSDLLDRHRPALFGLAFAPGRLPPPYLYGVQVLADRFDPAGQRWTPVAVDAAWAAPPPGRGARVHLRGTLPGGVSTVPLPLYARVLDLQAPAARVPAADGALLLRHPEPFDIDLTVELPPAPRFEDATIATAAPAALRRATVPDDELPGEALEAVDAAASLPPLQRALALRDFVRRRYRYDPTYIEDPAVARWLRGVTRGRAHVHVAALHAGRDARHLGRGVCYELASLACELLRRADLPAAVATGWTFDRGQVDLPDHMWVMVLLETADGPRWLPLDPSTTQDGRPLHVGPRPPGPWRPRAPKQPRPLPRRPDWAESGPAPGRSAGPPVPELLAVARYLERLTGEPITDDAALRRRCRALLADDEAARAFAAWLRGD
ncbi:MAG: transglutaminase domain-containing protein [Myxococcales bacterium]|nr:transglutaminase domain-containing protein [Myxococcales bacterium]